jgi:hypothetical protein
MSQRDSGSSEGRRFAFAKGNKGQEFFQINFCLIFHYDVTLQTVEFFLDCLELEDGTLSSFETSAATYPTKRSHTP